MSLDPYAPCPCGSGKKLKFCCTDVAADIEKIHRMIRGDQPRAALQHVEQTLAAHPNRVSLLDLKANLEMALGQLHEARSTVDRLLQVHPGSPTGLAALSILCARTDARVAAQMLQKALNYIDRAMPIRVLEAIGVVGHALLLSGRLIAAQAHLWLCASIAEPTDTRAIDLLVGMNRQGDLPLLVRDRLQLRAWPTDVAWTKEAEQASMLADRGQWQKAVDIIDSLGQQYGADPSLVYNRALLGGWLGDNQAMVAGFHAFARLNVPWDEAVEAEAIAQLLDPELMDPTVDTVRQVYRVHDLHTLEERLGRDKRTDWYEPEPAELGDQPRPRSAYLLLDRPIPDAGREISRNEVPLCNGFVSLFGRQTDRPERLELVTDRGSRFEQTIAILQEVGGAALGPLADEQVVGKTTEVEHSLSWRWAFPADTPPARRRELLAAERRDAIVRRWPEVPRQALDHKTPRQAAADDSLRLPLAAAVLILEQSSSNAGQADAIHALRVDLGHPLPEPIEPDADTANLSLAKIPRLQMEQVSDEVLVQLYRRALLTGATTAVRATATEVLRRPSVADTLPLGDVYQNLIALESDSAKALALMGQARQWAKEQNQSTATWDLAELELHLSEANIDQAQRMLQEIRERYAGQPDVLTAVYQLLYDMGLVSPDEGPFEQQAAGGILPTPPAGRPAESERRIWMPGDPTGGSGSKPSLWTPS